MNIPLVDLKAQYNSIKDEIDGVVSDVLSKSAFIGGSYVSTFETAFAGFCKTKHCVGVGNGTDALFIALKTLGIGCGDEVITAANSFIATSEAITLTGAKVVFADINPLTYNMDAERIEKKITAKTKAIVPIHLYGQPADMDPILDIARKDGLIIIEDAAQAHGAEYKGRRVGSIGDMACFSFYPGKNLGAYGDAGAIVTSNDELALKARMYANHGRISKYDHDVEGVNSRLDGLQAAILTVKLKYLDEWTEKRRTAAYRYNDLLKGSCMMTPAELKDVRAVYHLYVVRVRKEIRRQLMDHLGGHGISTGIHYPIALPNLKAYTYLNHSEKDFPEATKSSQEIVSLPLYPELREEQIQYICETIAAFRP